LLPIAWITWIFPNLKVPGGHPWTVWWENFTRWLLFAPFAMFFFYLATGLANTKGFTASPGSGFVEYLGGTILIVGLLLGGLVVSNKMGISGGAMALGAVATMKGWAKEKGGVLAGRVGKGILKGGIPYGKDEEGKAKKFRPVPMAADKLKLAGAGQGFFTRGLTAPIRSTGRGIVRLTELAEGTPWKAAVDEVGGVPTPNLAEEMFGYSPRKFTAAAARMQALGLLWEPEKLSQYLAEHWEEVLGSFPVEATKERLNLEAKLGMPLKSFRHLKPLFELEDTDEFKKLYADMLTSEAYLAKDDDGQHEDYRNLVRALSTGLVRAGKIKAEVDPEQIREALEEDIKGWLPGKSGSAVASGEPELDRVRIEGGDYGRTAGAQNLVRRARIPAILETRPEQVNRSMAGGFPEGLRFWNQQREDHLGKLDQELLAIVRQIPGVSADALREVSAGISKKDIKEIAEAIQKIPFPKGTDAVAWREIIDRLPDRKIQQRAIKLQQQGAEGLSAMYRTLMQGRRTLFQWGYFTGQA
ncbi:MAG: hypothetical protein HYS88_01860, partial [Candidatus Colwellbacteria bacterium]|nr:hypothetical protein [Candidatus Colwellbacteria bacterium]